jgi:hypothetical protein
MFIHRHVSYSHEEIWLQMNEVEGEEERDERIKEEFWL